MAEGERKMKIAGVYRVAEPIENLRIRVKVVQQTSLLGELFGSDGETRDPNFLEAEERIFAWQQKVFSPFESNFYADEKNCLTDRQKKYHRQIKSKNLQGSRLFSYTRNDNYCPDEQLLTKPYKSRLSLKNQSALPAIPNRKPFGERYDKRVVDYAHTEERIRSNHYLYTEKTSMFILADLSRKEEAPISSRPDSETLLCTITYDSVHRILTVFPDFSGDRRYVVVNDSAVKYDYWIEHASEVQPQEETGRRKEDARITLEKQRIYNDASVYHELQLSSPNTLRIFLSMEIASAHDFPYDGLYVAYCIDLPRNWATDEKEKLSGRTQRSRMRNRTAHFSYVTDVTLHCNSGSLSTAISGRWPCLLIAVSSLDKWTRYVFEKMRSRSNSGVRLDYYQRIVHKIIMKHQHPVTGLFPASPDNNHAWVRDNVYCILAVWGLSMAYKKIADVDEDRAKTYELEQSCVKLMRGLLMAMMQQKEKVEKFKSSQNPLDALHAKYSSVNGQTVVGDNEWGHLQIDAISLYLLILAQMTASGLQIIFNLDEVAFIQNLVFYIESAYCTPDYGIWERGDKTNHGLPELNASSIGMAKAALEAMNELDLFGARGGPTSVIHVLADEAQKCQAVLQSMLPRESNSKELDSGLLAIISFPAFAVDEPNLIHLTRDTITKKLQGRYGCKRFLRDGYRTPKEDPNRLYYEPWELRMFENIECEWPLFFCYLILDYCFQGNKEAVAEYSKLLEEITIKSEDGMKLVPELYSVAAENVSAEYAEPGSQTRIALGRTPFMWAQSLYILGKLLQEGFLAVGELDPLNRRLCSEKKPDVVVQVVILAEDMEIREKIAQHDIHVQTIAEVAPIEVQPAKVLSHLYTYLGRNKKLGLSGRKSRDVGILSTSKLYSLQDKIFAFTPQLTDMTRFYIASDYELMIDIFKGEINFLKSSWQNMLGRPLVVMPLKNIHLDQGKIPLAMITTMKKLKSGYINGTRVSLGNLNDFLSTSCITNLSFLGSSEDGRPDKLNPHIQQYLEEHLMRPFPHRTGLLNRPAVRTGIHIKRRMSVKGAIKKTRSIAVEPAVPAVLRESEILGMAGEDRRPSTILSANPFIEVTDTSLTPTSTSAQVLDRTPSPTEDVVPWRNSPKLHRHRGISETQYADTEVEELMAMLRETESLEEQGDILQYLVDSQGLYFNTGMVEEGHPVLVKDLLKGLYEKACQQKMWGIVRHTAGMLGKRVEDLAKAVTDLLVRQKQVTVGMPPTNEHTIVAPLPENELRSLIHQAYGDDESTAMLTQELLVYLAMFIRTEPQLFNEMLRLRVGLIIQVMATELSRTLICTGEEASEHLLNLSPFEMKNLLHHIMSGKEFAISSVGRGNFSVISCKSSRVSKKSQIGGFLSPDQTDAGESEQDRQGQWLRRRRLDGALNRVPRDFYPRVWHVLERCQGLAIEGRVLPQNLTQEMTSGELKFALAVETVLNTIPQPEYRQLVVEALMVLTLVTEYNIAASLGGLIAVEHLVHKANAIFLEDQMKIDGDATLCCAKPKEQRDTTTMGNLLCGGAAYICQHFYDSAPSGSYGTMTYITRAVASLLNCLPKDGDLECSIS